MLSSLTTLITCMSLQKSKQARNKVVPLPPETGAGVEEGTEGGEGEEEEDDKSQEKDSKETEDGQSSNKEDCSGNNFCQTPVIRVTLFFASRRPQYSHGTLSSRFAIYCSIINSSNFIGEGFIFASPCFANLCENKVLANEKCFTVYAYLLFT